MFNIGFLDVDKISDIIVSIGDYDNNLSVLENSSKIICFKINYKQLNSIVAAICSATGFSIGLITSKNVRKILTGFSLSIIIAYILSMFY